jgi:hypothetical protein
MPLSVWSDLSVAEARAPHDAAAAVGWGAGLTLIGIVVLLGGVAILTDYKGMARRYHASTVAAGSSVWALGSKYKEAPIGRFRGTLGPALIFFGVAVMTLGVYTLSLS